MEISLKGKVALVTGGSKGLGKKIVMALGRAGAEVVACGRSKESLRILRGDCNQLGYEVHTHASDATDPRDIELVFAQIINSIGRLDILVNNVGGVNRFGSFFDLSAQDWEGAYRLNFMSMVHFTREAIPFLRRSGGGRIVNISSVPARQPGLFNPHYSAAKAAMLNLSKHLANTLGKYKILVNSICPSTLHGGAWEKNAEDRASREQISVEAAKAIMESEEGKKNSLGRIGTLDEVANMVVFLCSDQASFITGTCIDIDGGTVRSTT